MIISAKSDIRGIIQKLADVKDKQLPFATSLAINRTAQLVKKAEQHEIKDVFDRPTPYIINSIFIDPSKKTKLEAKVWLKDKTVKGTPATNILEAEIVGGQRRLKRYEKALRAAGAMPDGYYTVAGEAARTDIYGNVARSQITHLLSYFKAFPEAGYKANSTEETRAKLKKGTRNKHGISYFVGSPADGKSPLGIWMRVHTSYGVAVRPILIFVKHTNYEATFDFEYTAKHTVDKHFDQEFIKAWDHARNTAN